MVPVVTSAGSVTLLEDDSAFSELLGFVELLNATELLDFTLLLDTLVSLSLDFGVTLDDDDLAPLLLDFVELLDFSEDEDFALEELDDFAELLLDTLVSLSLDCGVTLEEEDSSQSSHTLEDEPSDGRVAKSLSSSPQATSSKTETAATIKENSCFVFSITDPLPDSFVSDNLYNFATSPILTKIYNKSGIVEIALKSFLLSLVRPYLRPDRYHIATHAHGPDSLN